MEECKTCELAIYCYSESGTWVFRTKQEMEEKREAMHKCPHHEKVMESRSPGARSGAGSEG
ncbi:MAG: hypothetical protein MUC41_19245 [Syntrophobacteraceae bacterium]|jgi:hypothetical protein|nr:hypothetical protein [Syntrophobacteraceae bacterium]